MIIASTRYGELGLSFIAYAHDQEKNKTKQKKKRKQRQLEENCYYWRQ